jgi:hypothetical protein
VDKHIVCHSKVRLRDDHPPALEQLLFQLGSSGHALDGKHLGKGGAHRAARGLAGRVLWDLRDTEDGNRNLVGAELSFEKTPDVVAADRAACTRDEYSDKLFPERRVLEREADRFGDIGMGMNRAVDLIALSISSG